MSDDPFLTPSSGVRRRTTPASGIGNPRRSPNYAARRMLVGTIVVAAVFAAGVFAWQITRGDSDTVPARERAAWTAIAFVDRVSGDVTYVDIDGAMIAQSAGAGRALSVETLAGRLAIIASRKIIVLPPPGSDDAPLEVDVDAGAAVDVIAGGDMEYLAAGVRRGGDVIVIDPVAPAAYDVGELVRNALGTTPEMRIDTLQTNRDGSLIAVADATNFQTIVLRPGTAEPIFLPDQPIAVGADLVATNQTVGTQADVALVALDRSTRAAVPTEIPVGGVFDGDRLVMVSSDGGVFRIAPGDDSAERLGSVTIPAGGTITWVRPTYDGSRLVVAGDTFEAIVDLDGETVFSTTFTNTVEPLAPELDWTCIPVGGNGGSHSIVDLASGEQLADLSELTIIDVADRGCAVLVDRNGIFEVVTADGVATLGRAASVVLGTGGHSAIRIGADGVTELVLLDDDMAISDTIDLSEYVSAAGTRPLIAFVPTTGG